jgi:hypothetical protein
LLIQQIKDVEEARDALLVAADGQHRPRCSASRELVRSSRPSCGLRDYRASLTIDDRLPPTLVWCQHPWQSGQINCEQGVRSPATPGSGRHLSRLRGSGCAINPIPRSVSGSGRESPRMVAGTRRRRSSPSLGNCLLRCGNTSTPESL